MRVKYADVDWGLNFLSVGVSMLKRLINYMARMWYKMFNKNKSITKSCHKKDKSDGPPDAIYPMW